MTTGKALNGKPYAGNPHVRFDEGEVASAATPRRGSLLYRTTSLTVCSLSAVSLFAVLPLYGDIDRLAGNGRGTLAAASVPVPENVPELMRTLAGVAVDTKDAWEKVRAPELLERFQKDVYGRRPAAANERGRVSFKTYNERAAMGGKAVRKLVRAEFDGPFGKFSFPFTVYIPKAEKPVPAFVSICLKGRSKVDADHAISSECWPVERIVARGFATAGFLTEDVATEKNTGFSHGVFKCMEKVETRDDESWGAISAWAWAASRVMDWIETEPAIAAARVGIVGHSRGGKTALWAGVTDRRFALVCSNDSGAHGAKLNHIRLPRSEDIASIPKNFPNWYCGNYPKKYGGREMSMDFDQHELLALVAPRLLCVGSASADYWAGPRGEWWSAKLASPAWEFYGRRGLAAKAFPAPGETQQDGDVSYHLRPGRHFLAPYDWDRYMDFAAKLSDGGSGLSALPVAKPPRDAVALFDGTQESFDANWTDMKGRKAKWKFVDGTIEATRGAGDIRTRREFGDVQLHVEWQVPADLPPYDMNSGNSGVFMMGLYEVQIFESHETDPADMKHPFYADGQAASIYGQNPPLVNPARRRGEWQTYDIVFYRPVFDGATCVRPGSVTAFLNGVLVQDGWPLEGPTGHIRRTRQTKPLSDRGPVKLQQHLCPVRFRNVWIRELPEGTRNMRPASGRSAAVERSVGNAVAGQLRQRTDCSTIYAP